jgi:polyisoprenyl-phosphate glycosyltransferase
MLEDAEMTKIRVSVVVPVYSGEKHIDELVDRLQAVKQDWALQDAPMVLSEVVLVDDCARDGSAAIIDQQARSKPWVVALHLARNSGQHAATMAGILYTSGDWIVTMDEDLQHPPERIVELLRAACETGGDVVYARAVGKVHGFFRDLASRSYKRMICWLANNSYASDFNSFRLIRGSVARSAASVCSYDTYFDVALLWFTQRLRTVDMTLHDERFQSSKRSGYSLRRLISHARKLLFSSQLKILRMGASLGLVAVAASGLLGLYVLVEKLQAPTSITAEGWTSLFLIITFFGGVTLLMLGLILEYMSVLIFRAHGRPLYFVIDRIGDDRLRTYFDGLTR